MAIPFSLSDATNLYSAEQSMVYALWAFYAAACYGAGGFEVPVENKHRYWVAAAVTLGFLVFTIGHLLMLESALKVMSALQQTICELAAKEKSVPGLVPAMSALTDVANPAGKSMAVHIAIDASVVAALWTRTIGALRGGKQA